MNPTNQLVPLEPGRIRRSSLTEAERERRASYRGQKSNAAQRKRDGKLYGDFLLTYEEWWAIWEASGHYHLRGKGTGMYCMSRINDQGDYTVGNVFIQLHSDNISQAQKGKPKSEAQKAKTREAMQGIVRATKTCPHCGKSGVVSNMNRWHFDNCKHAAPTL
jgi:hypothetical protein